MKSVDVVIEAVPGSVVLVETGCRSDVELNIVITKEIEETVPDSVVVLIEGALIVNEEELLVVATEVAVD